MIGYIFLAVVNIIGSVLLLTITNNDFLFLLPCRRTWQLTLERPELLRK